MNLRNLLNLDQSRQNVHSSILMFLSLDLEALASKLKLAEKGRINGQLNLPRLESQTLDSVEQEIVSEIEHELSLQFNQYSISQQTYAARAGALGIQPLISRIESTAGTATVDFEASLKTGKNVLYVHKREVLEAEKELQKFKREHNLARPAFNIGPKAIKVGLLLVILVAEGVMNGIFIAEGSQFGLLGGIIKALVIAAFNVGLGFSIGKLFVPRTFHRNIGWKIFGSIATVFLFSFVVTFNLFIAHYRSALENGPLIASHVAINTFTQTPFRIDSTDSLLLFGLGIAFSLIAAIDAFLFDDPYPGYGRRALVLKNSISIYTEEKDALLEELKDIRDQAKEDIDKAVRDITARQGEYEAIISNSHSLTNAMRQALEHFEQTGNALLQVYRGANIQSRNTDPPSYFRERWKLARPNIETEVVPQEHRTQIEESLSRAARLGTNARAKLDQAYSAAMAGYQQVDALDS